MIRIWLLIALAWLCARPAHSADAEAPEADSQDRQEAPKDTDQRSNEVFVPTEEISEDISVAFPVDI